MPTLRLILEGHVRVDHHIHFAPAPARHLRLALPFITKDGHMANFPLQNDKVYTIPILVDDAAGTPVAAPSGDVFTVTSDNPAALATSIGQTASGAPALILTPLVRSAQGITVTVSDSAGLTAAVQLVDIGEDVTPTTLALDTANATTTAQPIPAA